MTFASLKQYELLGLALITVQKSETEARNVEPDLRCMVLLSNTYDWPALKLGEAPFVEDGSTSERVIVAAN